MNGFSVEKDPHGVFAGLDIFEAEAAIGFNIGTGNQSLDNDEPTTEMRIESVV